MKHQLTMVLTFLAFVTFFATVSIAADFTEGLIAYWPLDDDVTDNIGNHNGTLIGGASFVEDDERGQVLEVDGVDGHAAVPHSDDIVFAITDSYTLSVWVKVLTLPGHWAGIVNKSRDISPHYGLWINGSNQWVGGGNNIIGSVVEADIWYHLALVQDADANKRIVYVNGEVDIQGSPIDSTGSGELWMGGAKSVNEFLHALIDDVALYNRALAPADVKELAGGISIMQAVEPHAKLTTTWGVIKQ